MIKKSKENFVAFPMLMSAFDHKGLFLTKNDVYAYNLLYLIGRQSMHNIWWGSVETTIVTLSKQLPMPSKNGNLKESDNKREIRRLLLSLHDKEYITISYEEESLEYDTLITINVPDASELDSKRVEESYLPKKDKLLKHVGWVGVTEEMFNACNRNPWHLRILIYTNWRMNLDNYLISMEEWAKVLGVSENTADKFTCEVNILNIVDKISGEFYTNDAGEVRRKPNKYTAVSVETREKRQEQSEGIEKSETLTKEVNRYLSAAEVAEKTSDEQFRKSNWTNPDRNVYLDGKDIVIWKESKCPIAIAHAEKRWAKIPENKQEELMKKYKAEIDKQKGEHESKKFVEEMSNMKQSPEEVAWMEREYKYIPKGKEFDMSSILD
ncbi:hypothetical protein [Paenibacillus sp. FSL H8-0332]|uniref:hypothetical protein n=1 Tax=Paenibacillus sp. FSL H8-0332 TaxID=2954742 RepID=UPI0030D3A89E